MAIDDKVTRRHIAHATWYDSIGVVNVSGYESKDIDAVVCESDALATGVISRLLTLGYHIPEDIRVIGYDNIPIAQMYHPAVTTVAIPIDNMSIAAVNALVHLIGGKQVNSQSFIPTLIVRETG